MSVTVETLAALRTSEGAHLLAEATRLGVDDQHLIATSDALRAAGHPTDLIAAAMTTARLRRRTADRLGPDADRMFFTPDGAEQATRRPVADHRAARFAAAGRQHVLDLCGGIGSDALALARAGMTVTAVDIDPLATAMTAANAAALGLANRVQATTDDVTDYVTEYFARHFGPDQTASYDGISPALDIAAPENGAPDAVFCDPARRRGGRRVFDPNAYSPPFSFVTDLLARFRYAGAKVAPGIDHAHIPDEVEAEWVSHRGTVVEAALWSPAFATAPRRATVLPHSPPPHPGLAPASITGSGTRVGPTGPVRQWLYDPDGAVVRAHLVAELADQIDATLLDERVAYLTSDIEISTPFAHRYRIEEVLPFSVKRLRSALRSRDAGALTILKRGSAVDVDQLRQALKPTGSTPTVVALTRIGSRPYALICTPPAAATGP